MQPPSLQRVEQLQNPLIIKSCLWNTKKSKTHPFLLDFQDPGPHHIYYCFTFPLTPAHPVLPGLQAPGSPTLLASKNKLLEPLMLICAYLCLFGSQNIIFLFSPASGSPRPPWLAGSWSLSHHPPGFYIQAPGASHAYLCLFVLICDMDMSKLHIFAEYLIF